MPSKRRQKAQGYTLEDEVAAYEQMVRAIDVFRVLNNLLDMEPWEILAFARNAEEDSPGKFIRAFEVTDASYRYQGIVEDRFNSRPAPVSEVEN